MRIGVYHPEALPISCDIYLQNLSNILDGMGVKLISFSTIYDIPDNVDLYWDPGLGFEFFPVIDKSHTSKPIVITIHGTALLSMKLSEYKHGFRERVKLVMRRRIQKNRWKNTANNYARVITVSEIAKKEILRYVPFEDDKVIPVYLGAEKELFYPRPQSTEMDASAKPYYFHISVYQPKKNIKALIKAYLSIASLNKIPDILIVSPYFSDKVIHPKITIINKCISRVETAQYMRNSFAFIFPSLHETFGLPLVEAMSCGIPIITSSNTACAEIVGDAALLVDPRNTREIAGAMGKLVDHEDLRNDLKQKALERSKYFSWEKCAKKHLEIFDQILKESK